MPNVREVLEKVSELKSRYAIIHELVTFLDTHCKSSDGGGPELRIQRDDCAFVSEDHVDAQLALLAHEMEMIQGELEEWENLVVTDEEKPAKKKAAGGKRKRASSRQRRNQPAASKPEGGGNGSATQ